jgi:hypothetical protein
MNHTLTLKVITVIAVFTVLAVIGAGWKWHATGLKHATTIPPTHAAIADAIAQPDGWTWD